MRFGKLDIDPGRSPAVLDTATWDREAARRSVVALAPHWDTVRWKLAAAVGQHPEAPGPRGAAMAPVPRAVVPDGSGFTFLVELADGQKLFIGTADDPARSALGQPFFSLVLPSGARISAWPTDAAIIHRFCRHLRPSNAPDALGRIPRLGIGTRMATLAWPGIFEAMDRKGFAANSVQNSVRELNLLDDLVSGVAPERNYASGFGMIDSGYTGSTFEGLWVSGTLASLLHGRPLRWGADADHIQVKRADVGFVRATRVIDAARYYTFFTLDVADVLHFECMARRGEGEALLERVVTDAPLRRDVQSWHEGSLDPDLVGRCVGKYWDALEATASLQSRIVAVRQGEPFDLELSFDEHPPEVPGPECISSEAEVLFVARELLRRSLPVCHLAPNFGIEKGTDYRLTDGLEGLQARVESIHRIAEATGFLLDFHSADDLSAATRRVLATATGGRMHFKISPVLQFLFAETVSDHHPDLFRAWWDDAIGYALAEAARGSTVAAASLAALRRCEDPSPSPRHEVFRQFFFAWPGRRDGSGHLTNREMLYALPGDTIADYDRRVTAYLCGLADDLFGNP